MNAKKMFLSLIPWLLFSMLIHRHGAQAAGIAALLAAGLAVFFLVKNSQHGSVKAIDVTGITTFGVLAAACFAGGTSVTGWVADYGRGISALVLAVVMLGSTLAVPFSEQYARETVPQQYWGSPVFRSVNRRISAVWGLIMLVMAAGHLLAGTLAPATAPAAGSGPVDLILNWVLPIGLIMLGINRTRRISGAATRQPHPQPRPQQPGQYVQAGPGVAQQDRGR